ncbi:glycosyl hydrolase [Streptomyces sp. NPDC050504]|uniref:glycosyl hydrolase n=1 Tax=Streptomyces sp. NPDC050504 TaxID=3365618 RepID=UPI0037BACA3F
MSGKHAAGGLRPPGGPRARLLLALVAVAALLTGVSVWLTGGDEDGTGDDRTAPTGNGLPPDAASGAPPSGPCAPTKILVPQCGAWWGAYVPYPEDGSSLTEAVRAHEKRIGRKLDLLYTYHDMSNTEIDGTLLTPDEIELGRDRMLMLAWETTVWKEKHHAGYTETPLGWKNVAAGEFDEKVIDPQARRLKAYGKRVFFSLDQEVDARIKEGQGTPEEYVAAYRHVQSRFKALGVTNVVWVWTVSGYLGNKALMKSLYPGDAYVDWLGMDQYNYFTCHDTTDWKDFDRSQRPTYDWLRAEISPDKPIMLAEFSTVPDPDNPLRKRDWFTQIPRTVKTMPGIRALVQWNRTVPGDGCDLTVNEGPGLTGYREAGKNGYFKQPVPGR